MTASLAFACLWVLVATGIGMLPARSHRTGAWALILAGIPLLGWVTYQNGPLWGLAALAAGASILRWPLVRLWQRLVGRPKG